jgi:hypothetical protein
MYFRFAADCGDPNVKMIQDTMMTEVLMSQLGLLAPQNVANLRRIKAFPDSQLTYEECLLNGLGVSVGETEAS